MILVSQDRNIAIDVCGDEKYWGETVYHKSLYFGTNLYMSVYKNDRIFLGTFKDEDEINLEIENIINYTADVYMISKPDLLV